MSRVDATGVLVAHLGTVPAIDEVTGPAAVCDEAAGVGLVPGWRPAPTP